MLSKGEVEGGYNAKKTSKGYPAVPGCTGFSLFRRSVQFFVYDGFTIPLVQCNFRFHRRGESSCKWAGMRRSWSGGCRSAGLRRLGHWGYGGGA